MAWGNPMGARWCTLYKGTPAEDALEPAVAALGVPYRTQFPLFLFTKHLKYFPDFALPTMGLIIEVDDDSHKRKKAADAERTAALNEAGWNVVRCTNEEALTDPHATVARLLDEAARLPVRTPVLDGKKAPRKRKRAAAGKRAASSAGSPIASRTPRRRRAPTPF